jgi:hypothetical protein
MVELLKPDTSWLTVANILLGFVTVACIAFFIVFVIKDLRLHSKRSKEKDLVLNNYL